MKDILSIFDNQVVDEQITNVTPDPPKKTKKELTEGLVLKYMEEYGITNPYIQSAMMGIILNEGGFTGKPENLYYTTAGRLAEVWSTFSNYTDSKGRKARAPEGQGKKYANELAKGGKYLKNPKALANFIYATQKGNRPNTDDGYVYRGRGLNQLTGRGSYKSLGKDLGVDLVTNPELLDTDPDLQAKAAVHFLHKRLTKELPYLTEKYSRYKKRFGNYVDINNIDNLKDASFILTSANAGFGSYPKQKAFNDRLAAAKKYETKVIQRKEGLQDEFVINSDELTTTEDPIVKEPIVEEPAVTSTNKVTPNFREEVDTPKIEENITPLPVNIPTSVNTIPSDLDFSEPQFINSNVQNFSAEELKRQEAFNTALSQSVMTNRALPKFGQGSMFGQGQLFGADKKKYGGSIRPRYYNNGGPLDGEPVKNYEIPTGNPVKSKSFLGALGDIARFSAAKSLAKTEVPEKGEGMSNYDYFNSLDKKQKASIPYKEQLANRAVQTEDVITSQIRENIAKIGSEIGANYGPENSIESQYDYLGIPFMYNQDSWFHNLKDNIYTSPYTCQGIACAIGRKAGAVNAKSYKTASARGTEGAPWAIETGGQTVDHADVLAGKGLYPVDDIQAGDMVRHGYKEGRTSHNTTALGPSVSARDQYNPEVVKFPATYGSHWTSGVMKSDDYYMDPKTDQAFRYLRNLPEYQKKLTSAQNVNADYQNYLDSKAIANLPIKEAELIRNENPIEVPYITERKYPDTLKGRRQQRQNDKFIAQFPDNYNFKFYKTGGNLGGSPCPSGQIYDETSKSCVSYETWEKNNSGFNMEDVKKENEDYFNANEWFKNYHNSPKYYEMTRSSFPEGGVGDMQAGSLRKRREQNLKSIPPLKILPQEEEGLGGLSMTDNGQIELFPEGFKTGTTTHELSHSTDRPVYFYPGTEIGRQRIMPESDSKYIDKRKADVLGDSREYFNYKEYYDNMIKNDPEKFKKAEEKFLDFSNYVAEDTETRARLNTIRRMAQEQGLYDPFAEGVSSDLYYQKLKKLKLKTKDRYKQGYNPMKQLQNTFSDEEIIWMLNNISENKTNNSNDTEGMA